MKIPLAILAIVAVSLLAFLWLAPDPGPDALQPRTDLPWQITVNPDGSSRVFDLDLGSATLADAMAKFGALEGLAVFQAKQGEPVLEAYFGNVQFGPLKAKVVAGLDADTTDLKQMLARAGGRDASPSGDWKYPLDDLPQMHGGRRLKLISYVPATRKLDAEFFRSRFGEPAAWLRENETAVSWFYPAIGLSVLIDDESSEVLEYQPPRDFVMPPGVSTDPAAP
jgi:hypothetical protein